MNIQNSKHRAIIFFAVPFLSLLASLYSFLSVDVINNDGILYVNTAEAYLIGGYSKALASFDWPLFPIVIAWLHKITGLTLGVSAYAVNAIMMAIVSVAFIRIVEESSVVDFPLWIPALIILTLPMLNEYRAYVIRGHGYWAFSTLALLFFIIYYKRTTISSALLWQLFVILGVLFRIEGVVFLLFAPLCLILFKEKRDTFFRHYLRLNSIILPAAVCAAIFLAGHTLSTEGMSGALLLRLGYMVPSSLFASIQEASSGIVALMPRLSYAEAGLVASSGLITLVVFKLVKNINLFYLLVIAVGHKKRWVQLSPESYIVLMFFAISVLPVVSIAGNQMFVSSRYTVLSVILFSLIVSQYLAYLLQKLIEEKKIFALSTMLVLVAVFFLDAVIHTGAVKGNIVTASEWAIEHIDQNAKIACNNKRFVFYTKKRCSYVRSVDEFTISDFDKLIKQGDYSHILLWVDGGDGKMREYLETNKSLELLKGFPNKKHDEARVYKVMAI